MECRRLLIIRLGLLLWICGGIGGAAFPQAKGSQTALSAVLERMGAVGKKFHGFSANFVRRKFVAVLKDFDEPESGVFLYALAADGSALLRQEFKAPGHSVLTIKGGVATVYQPSINQAHIVDLGKNKDKAEYLALGIGQSAVGMQKTFDVELTGHESIDGTPCAILVLKPKSSAVAAYFSVITLWVSDDSALPIQQKLQEPNGDYQLNKFSSENLNPKVSASDFEQKLPKGVEIQRIK